MCVSLTFTELDAPATHKQNDAHLRIFLVYLSLDFVQFNNDLTLSVADNVIWVERRGGVRRDEMEETGGMKL